MEMSAQENKLKTNANTNTDKVEERVVSGCLESTGYVKLLIVAIFFQR